MKEANEKLINLLLICVLLICISGYFAYRSELKKNPKLTMSEFIGINPRPSFKSVMIGMASNLAFGMIDNGGLWTGMDALDPFLPGGHLTKAALGNTFSDGLGAFLGTFCGIIIKNNMDKEDKITPPMWSEAVGIIAGCLLVIPIMRIITGKN